MIDWSQNAFVIERRVRGLQPWPNAYTTFKSKRVTIWRAEVGPLRGIKRPPGEVIAAHGPLFVVACGDKTTLNLREIQPEAARRMAARDFINGMHIVEGDRFG